MTAHAYSIDGRTFSFESRLANAAPIGSYVTIETENGTYLGQVLDSSLGAGIAASDSAAVSAISGRGRLLSQLVDEEFTGLDHSDVFGDGAVAAAAPELVAAHLSSSIGSSGATHVQNVPPRFLQ
mgnify:FL=1